CEVLLQSFFGEGDLSDDEVQVRVLVDAEFDLSALDVGHGLRDVHGHGAGLRVRHQATGTEHLAETTDLAHHVVGRNSGIEVGEPSGHLLQQVIGADVVGTSFTGSSCTAAGSEHQAPGGLTGTMQKVHGAAHHRARLAVVNS